VQGRPERGLSFTSQSLLLKLIIHCFVSVNVQQASLNINGCNFFRMEKFSDTQLLPAHLHTTRHFARLHLFCYLSHGSKTYELLAGRFNLYCHNTSIRL
jgi:hypothetical protein